FARQYDSQTLIDLARLSKNFSRLVRPKRTEAAHPLDLGAFKNWKRLLAAGFNDRLFSWRHARCLSLRHLPQLYSSGLFRDFLSFLIALDECCVVRRHQGIKLRKLRCFWPIPSSVSFGENGVRRCGNNARLREAGKRRARCHLTRVSRCIDHRVDLEPRRFASSAGNMTQTLVQTPAIISVFRPVSRTVLTKSSLSQAFTSPLRGT